MHKLSDEQRAFVEKLLREDRLTLNEMLDEIRTEFPAESIPSRSALGREKKIGLKKPRLCVNLLLLLKC